MTSLALDYHGLCPPPEKYASLLTYLSNWQEVANTFLDETPPPVQYDNFCLEGNVLISKRLFPTADTLPLKAHPDDSNLLILEDVALNGMEVLLPDADNISGGPKRVSFVFTSHSNQAIDGLLVLAENQAGCRLYTNPVIQQSDWYLGIANIHLRYYLAGWAPKILGWIRRQFMPTLHSRVAEHLLTQEMFSGTSALSPELAFMQGNKPDAEFRLLMDEYLQEGRPGIMKKSPFIL